MSLIRIKITPYLYVTSSAMYLHASSANVATLMDSAVHFIDSELISGNSNDLSSAIMAMHAFNKRNDQISTKVASTLKTDAHLPHHPVLS